MKAHHRAMETHHGATEAYPRAMKAHLVAIKSHPGAAEPHPGATEAHPELPAGSESISKCSGSSTLSCSRGGSTRRLTLVSGSSPWSTQTHSGGREAHLRAMGAHPEVMKVIYK